jgi:hypothetical protein
MKTENRYSFNPEVHRILESRRRSLGQNWIIVKRETRFAHSGISREPEANGAGASFFVGRRFGSGAH